MHDFLRVGVPIRVWSFNLARCCGGFFVDRISDAANSSTLQELMVLLSLFWTDHADVWMDPLRLKPNKKTYWVERKPSGPEPEQWQSYSRAPRSSRSNRPSNDPSHQEYPMNVLGISAFYHDSAVLYGDRA